MTATGWSSAELDAIGGAEEMQIAVRRVDGTLSRYITIWVVRDGDDLYVRSYYGRDGVWFRRAMSTGSGRVQVGGMERNVGFEDPGHDVDQRLDEAYRAKYRRYGGGHLESMISKTAAAATLKLVAQADSR